MHIDTKNNCKLIIQHEETLCSSVLNINKQKLLSVLFIVLQFTMSIHKAQGKSLARAILDLRALLATGKHSQMYVALSQVRTLEGIRFFGSLDPKLLTYR